MLSSFPNSSDSFTKTFAGIPYESVESKLANGEANPQEITSLFDAVEVEARVAL